MYYIPDAVMKKQPTTTAASAGKEWRFIKEIGCSGEVNRVKRVAICNDGNIAVIGYDRSSYYGNPHAHLIHNGQYQHITSPDNKEAKLIKPNGVAVTPNNKIIITDTSKYIKLFHPDGQYMRSICTLTQDENPDTEVITWCVAVSSQGFILVGDPERGLITIHHESDNSFYKSIETSITPVYIAVTSQLNILVSDCESKVVAYNMESGGKVFVIDSWKLDGESGNARPWALACDTEGNVYIAVRSYNTLNTGHVHVYNKQGQYLQCIVKGLWAPYGLAWYNNSLYIADHTTGLKIYSNV